MKTICPLAMEAVATLPEARVSEDGPSDLKAVDIVNHTHILAYGRTTTTVIATQISEFHSKLGVAGYRW